MDLADSVVVGARSIHPLRDIRIRSTCDTLDVDITSGVVVASYTAAVIHSGCVIVLGVRDVVRKRHATES